MKLSFNAGKFVMTGLIEANEKWTLRSDGITHETTDYREAARYKNVADLHAQRVLQRAFSVRYAYNACRNPLPFFLDSHQTKGVEWILTRSRSYLAHVAGAGKTCQAVVAAILSEGEGQNVFIVPPSLTVNWAREITHWHDLLFGPKLWASVAVVPETSNAAFTGWRSEFLIVPDSMLTKPWVLGNLIPMKKKLIAVDEASRFKETTSQRTIALFGGTLNTGAHSPGLIHDAKHAVLLDGSPMPNRPMELWGPTYAMCPESIDFMSQVDFGYKYCGAKINHFGRWEFKHSSREGELKKRLQKDFMHVVTESELSHPERRRSILFMSDDVRSPVIKAWERRNLHLIKFDEIDEDLSQGEISHYRALLGQKKAPWIASYTRDRLETGESVLLFAWHRDVCTELARLLAKYKPGLVMGGTPEKQREKMFENFQCGKIKLIIGNIMAMGRGHNLQRADRVIFGEFSWTDETNTQCEKRTSRRGNDKEFTRCDYIVAPSSMDEPILNAVFRKAERVKKVIG